MRARFERWQLDLRNGLRLFHAMDGWLPKEIEEHILQYLRHVGYTCYWCGYAWVPIMISIDVPLDVYCEDYPDMLCLGCFNKRKPKPKFDFYADINPFSLDAFDRQLVWGRKHTVNPWSAFFGDPPRPKPQPKKFEIAWTTDSKPVIRKTTPAPEPESKPKKGVPLRTHFVALERKRERDKKKHYQNGRGKKKK